MRGHRADVRAGLGQAALQLGREEQVGELGLAVGGPALVAAAVPVEVVEADLADPVRDRRDSDDALADPRQQQVGQREVAEVVGADLQLEAVLCARLGRGHDAGVVDQDVEVAVPALGELPDRREVGEVEPAHRDGTPHVGRGLLAPGGVAHGEGHARAGAGELAGGDPADPAVGAGHDHGAPVEVGQVGCGPLG